MNARQKAKQLKKEVAKLREERKPGSKWLKIDGCGFKQPEPKNYLTDISPFEETGIFQVRIGQTTLEGIIHPDDKMITVDDSKIDHALDCALAYNKGYNAAEDYYYSRETERIEIINLNDKRVMSYQKPPGVLKARLARQIGEAIIDKGLFETFEDQDGERRIITERTIVEVIRR